MIGKQLLNLTISKRKCYNRNWSSHFCATKVYKKLWIYIEKTWNENLFSLENFKLFMVILLIAYVLKVVLVLQKLVFSQHVFPHKNFSKFVKHGNENFKDASSLCRRFSIYIHVFSHFMLLVVSRNLII